MSRQARDERDQRGSSKRSRISAGEYESRRDHERLRRERSPPRSREHRRRSRSPVVRERSPERPRGRQRSRSKDTRTQPISVGSIVQAKVHTVKPFGVFVALDGHDRHALVHHTQVAEELALGRDDDDADKVTALEYFCRPGSLVWVKVTEVRDEGPGPPKIGGSMKAVDQETGRDADPENRMTQQPRGGGPGGSLHASEAAPELGSVHRATVASVRPFGVFVRIEGYRNNGLVHFSQISDHLEIERDASDEAKTAAVGQVLAAGEACWVKVVELKEGEPGRGPRVGCSVKLVSQKDGADLDPHGLKYRPRQGDGGGFGARSARPVGADVGQAQQGVVDWGHLNADKVAMDPRYANYELIGDEVEALEIRAPAPGGEVPLPGPPKITNVTSVAEALAVLRKHESRKDGKKSKRKRKDAKSEKKTKKHREKKKPSKADSSSSSLE